MMTMDELRERLLQGVVLSVLHAQRHYYVYRLIGENASKLNAKLEKEEYSSKKISYIQESAREGAILNLAKYFEGKSSNHNYCIERYLNQCESNVSNKTYLPQYLDSELISLLQNRIGQEGSKLESVRELFSLIKKILSEERVTNASQRIKIIRDKTIAHHEMHKLEPIPEFWIDFEYLLFTARLINAALAFHLFAEILNVYDIKSDEVIDQRVCVNQFWLNNDLEAIIGEKPLVTLPKFSHWYNQTR